MVVIATIIACHCHENKIAIPTETGIHKKALIWYDARLIRTTPYPLTPSPQGRETYIKRAMPSSTPVFSLLWHWIQMVSDTPSD
jgi:hypothetical protein